MNVALVSEGPSAAAFPGPAGYDAVVGVNGVPTRWLCDWWVFADPDFYVCVGPSVIGHPMILTTSSLERAMNEHQFRAAGLEERYREDRAAGRIKAEEDMPLIPAMPREVPILSGGNRRGQARWFNYSGLGGLTCCWFLAGDEGSVEVDVFGVDMQGIGDVHGKDAVCRSVERWERERRIWDGLVEGFERTGRMRVHWTPPEKR